MRKSDLTTMEKHFNIVDEICPKGGDKFTGIFGGNFIDIANILRTSTVCKIWRQYRESKCLSPKHGGGNKRSLSECEIQLIEVLKR